MKLTTLFTSLSLASIALSSPIPDQTCLKVEAVYTVESFTTRKYDGQTINTVSFNIKSADGGSIDLNCVAYDPALGRATESFESGEVYRCGLNSSFLFAYTPNADEDQDDLFLWQEVSGIEILGGSMTPASGICQAGGSGANDLTCVASTMGNVYVEMERL